MASVRERVETMMAEVVFEALYDDVAVPSRATAHSAGFDLSVYLRDRRVSVCNIPGVVEERAVDGEVLQLAAGETALLPLGFRAQLPAGYEAQIRIRSSWAFKRGLILPNAPGTIDADYPDEWLVLVKAAGKSSVSISHGDRVAQAVLARYEVLSWQPGRVLRISERAGGLGSTG